MASDQRNDSHALRIFSVGGAHDEELDVSGLEALEFFKNDIVRYRLTGVIPAGPDFRVVNFVACTLHDVKADHVDFSECDFKDTLIKEGAFSSCQFDSGAFATTFICDTNFDQCTFYNLSAHNCEFHRVRFVDCDLTNVLIKSSRFSDCSFENCITVNRICEMSTLFDVAFINTPIQLDTITSNFGISKNDLKDSLVRTGRVREPHSVFRPEDLQSVDRVPGIEKLSALERLSFEYFISQTLVDGSPTLDEALNIVRWTNSYQNPASFVELLDKFAEFLIHLYDDGRLAVHPLLLLHHVTSTLTDSIRQDEGLHQVIVSLGGIHLMLSRVVEEFLGVLELALNEVGTHAVFRAEGPDDPLYFSSLLERWIGSDVTISRLARNSPLLVEFVTRNASYLVPLIAAFVATRTKLEITRLKTSMSSEGDRHSTTRQRKSIGEESPNAVQLFSFTTGPGAPPSKGFELKLRALMPGSLLLDLRLDFSTTLIRRLRAVLLVLLTGNTAKIG